MKTHLLLGPSLGLTLMVASCGSVSEEGAEPPDEAVGTAQAAEKVASPPDAPAVTPHATGVRRADGLMPGMIPYRGGPDRYVTPSCKTPKLAYFGGPILQSPVIVAVFWNGNVNPTLMAPTTGIGQFYTDVTQSSYWSWLQEYNTVGLSGGSEQAILPGSFGGQFTLTPSHCPTTTSTKSCSLTDDELQSELNAQIAAGVLPVPTVDCTGNTNTIYMVHFPPDVSLSGPSGSGASCVQFCAYHNTGTYSGTGAANGKPLVYAALMDQFTGTCATGCGGNATPLENSTDSASHELVEAVTDTDIGLDTANGYAAPAAWGDNNNQCGEIGDICDSGGAGDTITVSGRSWVVQELWSNKQGKCTSTGPDLPACSGTTLTNCRKCSCGDNGGACSGGTAVCETDSSNVLFGACEQCTAASNTCGGGTCEQSSTPAQDDICNCTPLSACPAGDNCGTVSNGCGGTVTCGACTAPQTCGGGSPSKANVCGCTPLTACPAGDTCGAIPDGCGGMVTCGTCTAPQTCGGGSPSNANACGCTPLTACPAGDVCGTVPDGCSGTVTCGSCSGSQICSGNQCVAASGATTGSGASSSGAGNGGSAATSSGSTASGNGGSGGGSSSGATTSTGTSPFGTPTPASGCSCKTAGEPVEGSSNALSAFGMLALAGVIGSRKRRRL